MKAVVLAGGTGGAKLAAGLQDVLGSELTVIANTGDDIEALGVHVSPDPDLISYWLTGQIDEQRGWGIAGDTFSAFERLVELGEPDWFGLGDRDLATCLRRRLLLDAGVGQTEAQEQLSRALGAEARVLAMCDQHVRTQLRCAGRWVSLQEFMVKEHGKPAIEEVRFDGIEQATLSHQVAEAIAAAEILVIGPSNPVISIGPILAVRGLKEALASASAQVVAVSPFIAGKAIKGPTENCMRAVGAEPSASGVAGLYADLIDGFVADDGDPAPPALDEVALISVPTLMVDRPARRRLAEQTLDFGGSLG